MLCVSKKIKLLIGREQDILNGFLNATLFCHFQIYPFPYSAQNETGKRLWTFYRLNYSKTELMTDLPKVCKFRFVPFCHI